MKDEANDTSDRLEIFIRREQNVDTYTFKSGDIKKSVSETSGIFQVCTENRCVCVREREREREGWGGVERIWAL